MKTTVFWDVELCSLVEIDRRFRYGYCSYRRPVMDEVSTAQRHLIQSSSVPIRTEPKFTSPQNLDCRSYNNLWSWLLIINSFYAGHVNSTYTTVGRFNVI
jgi:hypothetical protein